MHASQYKGLRYIVDFMTFVLVGLIRKFRFFFQLEIVAEKVLEIFFGKNLMIGKYRMICTQLSKEILICFLILKLSKVLYF